METVLEEQEMDVADPRMENFGPIGCTENVFLFQARVPGSQLGI
jgi:hypothetical protein